MLPPFPEKLPPKAEPGKPLYTRKPPQRQRPVAGQARARGRAQASPDASASGGRPQRCGRHRAAGAASAARSDHHRRHHHSRTRRKTGRARQGTFEEPAGPRRVRQHQPGAGRADGHNSCGSLQRRSERRLARRRDGAGSREGRNQGKFEAAAAGGDGDGPRGSWQNEFAGRHSRSGCCRGRSGRNHTAHRRVQSCGQRSRRGVR